MDLKDALTQHQMKLDMLKHGDVMDIQAEMQKGNWSFFSASRPDGILNQKFTQLLVACEVVSVMYNGLSSATMSQPQSLKFHQSLLPAKYEGCSDRFYGNLQHCSFKSTCLIHPGMVVVSTGGLVPVGIAGLSQLEYPFMVHW